MLELERDTTLNCTADANPPPSYTWKTSGTHEKMGKTPVLPIDVAGNYTCTASNRLGSGTKHFIVVSRSSGENMSNFLFPYPRHITKHIRRHVI